MSSLVVECVTHGVCTEFRIAYVQLTSTGWDFYTKWKRVTSQYCEWSTRSASNSRTARSGKRETVLLRSSRRLLYSRIVTYTFGPSNTYILEKRKDLRDWFHRHLLIQAPIERTPSSVRFALKGRYKCSREKKKNGKWGSVDQSWIMVVDAVSSIKRNEFVKKKTELVKWSEVFNA